jgi:hypothetical protein
LGPAFDASSETLYLAARPSDLAKLEPLQQATIAEAADGIAIQATGNDPALFLPEFPVKPCIVKIEISAPADTAIQIFYLTGTQTVYTEPNSAVQRLKSGKNLTYFKIDKPDLTGKWRLDPGGVSGTYIIHGIEIRAVGATSPVAH